MCIRDRKVSDHHAIIPTMEVAKADIGKLKERNCKILYLISARVLTATADPVSYTHLDVYKRQVSVMCRWEENRGKKKKTLWIRLPASLNGVGKRCV